MLATLYKTQKDKTHMSVTVLVLFPDFKTLRIRMT